MAVAVACVSSPLPFHVAVGAELVVGLRWPLEVVLVVLECVLLLCLGQLDLLEVSRLQNLPGGMPYADDIGLQGELVGEVPEEPGEEAVKGEVQRALHPTIHERLGLRKFWVHEPYIVSPVDELGAADGVACLFGKRLLVLQIGHQADMLQVMDDEQDEGIPRQGAGVRVVHPTTLGPSLHQNTHLVHAVVQIGVASQQLRVVQRECVVERNVDGQPLGAAALDQGHSRRVNDLFHRNAKAHNVLPRPQCIAQLPHRFCRHTPGERLRLLRLGCRRLGGGQCCDVVLDKLDDAIYVTGLRCEAIDRATEEFQLRARKNQLDDAGHR
mmetsp:Transcript_45293/g.131792  ORF Transcript_45293/g.131792 Transcript_45293/m.131792 type:complete len:326 (+) Transcript_45293:269-1246(+)